MRYEAVNGMLLNEFLKEHKRVEQQAKQMQEQRTTIGQLKKDIGLLTAQLKEQAVQIQKVNARLEMQKPGPNVANNR